MRKAIVTNEYELINDEYYLLKIIGSKHGYFEVMIDKDDYKRVSKLKWYVNKYTRTGKIYWYMITTDGTLLHRFIMGDPINKMVVDHKDNNTLDNRKSNLEIVTRKNNCRKAELCVKNKGSGYPGVYWYTFTKTPVWIAYITVDYKRIHLGSFSDLDEAIKVRKQAEKKYFGEFTPNIHN
jgi:hypothetical protein